MDLTFDAQHQMRSDLESNKVSAADIFWEGDLSVPFLTGSVHVEANTCREYMNNIK